MPIATIPYVVLGGLLAVLFTYAYGHHEGRVERDREMQAEIAKANEQSREIERVMTGKLTAKSNELLEANNAIDQKQSALTTAIRAGRVRLPAASCVQTSPSAPAPSGDSAEAPSESDRQTLAAIAAIVADGDRAINQLNACIDAYNQMKEQINGSNR